MANAVYHDKAFMFIKGYGSGEAHLPSRSSEYKLLNMIEIIKAVSATALATKNGVQHDKALIFIRATFREKLASHHKGSE